jgi:hypothetical protein
VHGEMHKNSLYYGWDGILIRVGVILRMSFASRNSIYIISCRLSWLFHQYFCDFKR